MEEWIEYRKSADFQAIAEKYHIDRVTARIIRNRNIVEDEQIRRFLQGDLSDLYDPHLLKDADLLCDILLSKIQSGQKIRVIGDYDIDGVMSSYLLVTALERLGADVSVQIPHRMLDGYGLNASIIDNAKDDGIDTILTCDNGIAAISEIALAKSYGMTVLVTDHHEIPYEEAEGEKRFLRSEADAIVNPHQEECGYPFKELCGAAVAWKVICIAYEKCGIAFEEACRFLENVAFATVGDIMSLTDENRILVKEGLKRMHVTENIGMKALISQCNLEARNVGTYHLGFVLGPCINASGRLDTAKRSLELFRTKDSVNAVRIAGELVTLNTERKDLTAKGVEEAVQMYEKMGYDKDFVLVIYLPDMHESIAGIVAGRIKEMYHKPTFILTKGEECVKGSGRSIEAYSMWEEMTKCRDLFLKYGGHPMAAGLSLPEENVDEFRRRMNENCTLDEKDLNKKVYLDAAMPLEYVSPELVKQLECLAPFGRDNLRPVFATRNIRIGRMWRIGKKMNVLRLDLITETGKHAAGIYCGDIDGMLAYLRDKYSDTEVERALHGQENRMELSVVYVPTINSYKDTETLQFEIQYYK